jgi:RimJ/RimL family protein N-acetyltransferase
MEYRGLPISDGAVRLRLPRDSDVAAVVTHGQEPDIEVTRWLPIPYPCPEEAARGLIDDFQQGWNGRCGLTLVIADPATDEFLGVIWLARRGDDMAEVSYGLAPRHRGRGIATRAVRLVERWCFEHAGPERLEIRTDVTNLASQRVAEKAGFTREGVVRTVVPSTGEEYEDVVYSLGRPALVRREHA